MGGRGTKGVGRMTTVNRKNEPDWAGPMRDWLSKGHMPRSIAGKDNDDMRAQFEYIDELYPAIDENDSEVNVTFTTRNDGTVRARFVNGNYTSTRTVLFGDTDKAKGGIAKWWYWSHYQKELKKTLGIS